MTAIGQNPDMLLLGCTGPMDSVIVNNILDSMSDSLIVIGEDGEILYVNKITERILGYSLSDFRKKALAELFFSIEQNHDFKQIFLDALWKKSIRNYREVDYHHPDGSVKRLAATTSYLLAHGDHESTFIGFVALFKDVTEMFQLRRQEQALIQEKQRIAREKIVSLQRLAMGVAHEIRNPTVTIGGFAARIMRNEKNPEETRRHARNILEDAHRLEALVNEVQEYCDIEEPTLAPAYLSELVQSVVSELTPLAKEANILLEIEDGMPLGHSVRVDRSLLKAALFRLVKNALDFSQEGSSVELVLFISEEGTVLEVRDHGSGIKEEDRDYIFNPFFSTQAQSSGMGLAIVERVVREHLGRIEVESEPDKGTTVRIILPPSLSTAEMGLDAGPGRD